MARLTVQVTPVIVIAIDQRAGFRLVDETQPRTGIALQNIIDIGTRLAHITSLVTQVQQPRKILRVDVVASDEPVEVLAGLETQGPDLPREVRAESGLEPLGLVSEAV